MNDVNSISIVHHRFGRKIKKLRTKANLSLRDIAGKIGISFTYLCKVEKGSLPPPSEKIIYALADVFKIDQNELLNLAGKVPPDKAQYIKKKALEEFGPRLRAIRNQAGLSLKQLGYLVYVDPSYISKIENAIKPPPKKMIIIRLANILKVDVEELLSLSGRRNLPQF